MGMLYRIRREISKSVAKRGVFGTLKAAPALVAARLGEGIRGAAARRIGRDGEHAQAGDAFDRRFGLDTASVVHLGALQIESPNWVHGLQYQPVGVPDFQALLDPTGIDVETATFIDLGSGKGRAVLLAARLPFRKVVGVEFSTELNAIAENNLRLFPTTERRCENVTLLHGDAAEYQFPDGPLVVYLFNPFEAPVMRQVIANMVEAYGKRPRPIVVLYFTPHYADLWRAVDFLQQASASDDLAVFVSQPP